MRIQMAVYLIPLAVLVMLSSAIAQSGQFQNGPSAQECRQPAPCEFAQIDSPEFDEPAPPPGMMPPGGGPRDGQGRRFEQLRLRKLAELLELRQDQKRPFMEAFRKMRFQQRQIEQQRRQLLDELSQMLKEDHVDEKALVARTDKLAALDRDRLAVIQELFQSARRILTPIQVAKMAIFQERFEAAALRMVREGRHRPGGPGGQNMPRPPDSFDERP